MRAWIQLYVASHAVNATMMAGDIASAIASMNHVALTVPHGQYYEGWEEDDPLATPAGLLEERPAASPRACPSAFTDTGPKAAQAARVKATIRFRVHIFPPPSRSVLYSAIGSRLRPRDPSVAVVVSPMCYAILGPRFRGTVLIDRFVFWQEWC